MTIIKFCFVILAIAAFIAACNQSKPANTEVKTNTVNAGTPAPPPTPLDDLAAGRKLYSDNCAICHKDTGTGGKVTIEGKTINPENLTAAKFKKATGEKLIGYVTNGVEDEGMPAFKTKLTEDQRKLVIKHVRSLQN